jgi:hypothetical protein
MQTGLFILIYIWHHYFITHFITCKAYQSSFGSLLVHPHNLNQLPHRLLGDYTQSKYKMYITYTYTITQYTQYYRQPSLLFLCHTASHTPADTEPPGEKGTFVAEELLVTETGADTAEEG